ncbi:MAG TPA: HIT family hydrolase, partial [Acidimicrobiales bacterium]|nr:HIT family hydrolase [Acidimicrobiales bacterium]
MSLERLWAGWRSEYVTSAAASAGDGPAAGDDGEACVMCRIVGSSDDRAAYVVHRGALAVVALNAFPYTSGHLMIMPTRHVAEPDALRADEST